MREESRSVRPGAGAVLVFWLLIGMGFATFAPCILLPEWREYQVLRLVEQREQFKIDQLQAAINDEQKRLEALGSDPEAVARCTWHRTTDSADWSRLS